MNLPITLEKLILDKKEAIGDQSIFVKTTLTKEELNASVDLCPELHVFSESDVPQFGFWTDNYIYFLASYDGDARIGCIPRNPVGKTRFRMQIDI